MPRYLVAARTARQATRYLAHYEVVEGFGECIAMFDGGEAGALVYLFSDIAVAYLAGMAVQGLDLLVDVVGDIDPVVRFIGGEKVDLAHAVGCGGFIHHEDALSPRRE